ncbi:MAG: hypothetical protein ACPGU7_12690, partial [Gammaproteobacteria bacterium]
TTPSEPPLCKAAFNNAPSIVTGTTYAAANQLVKRFEKLGLLEETTGQARNRKFRYGPYIDLFADEAEAEGGH